MFLHLCYHLCHPMIVVSHESCPWSCDCCDMSCAALVDRFASRDVVFIVVIIVVFALHLTWHVCVMVCVGGSFHFRVKLCSL